MSNRSDNDGEWNQYTTKAMRDHLGNLSKIAFGSRGRWKKLCNELGLNIHSIKEQMEAIVKYKVERLEHVKRERDGARNTGSDKVRQGKAGD